MNFLGFEGRHQLITYAAPKWKVTRTVDGFWRVGVGIYVNAVFTDWRDAIDYAARKAWS